MRQQRAVAAGFAVAALLAACSTQAPSALPGTPPVATSAASATGEPSVAPSPTPVVGVRAPGGVTTEATVVGEIYLGFEACVALAPGPASPYLPPPGQDDFVIVFPRGWKVVPEHPTDPRFGDQFEVFDGSGKVVARDGDRLEVKGLIRAKEASHCGFGWPISVRSAQVAKD